MAAMDSIALSSHSSSRQSAPDLRTTLFNCLLVMAALGLAVVLWHVSSSPRQVITANRLLSDGASAGQGRPLVGDLVRWHGSDGVERLLVANGPRDAIVAYAADTGEPLAMTVAGRFEHISGLTLRGDRLHVTDLSGRREQVLLLPGLQLRESSSAAHE